MNIIENELIVMVDVDGTLIRPADKGSLSLPYGSGIKSYEPITAHVDLVKEYHNRGYYITVWSAGGFKWAWRVVQALKLERHVHQVMSKPSKFVDDKDNLADILGTRVFIA